MSVSCDWVIHREFDTNKQNFKQILFFWASKFPRNHFFEIFSKMSRKLLEISEKLGVIPREISRPPHPEIRSEVVFGRFRALTYFLVGWRDFYSTLVWFISTSLGKVRFIIINCRCVRYFSIFSGFLWEMSMQDAKSWGYMISAPYLQRRVWERVLVEKR